MHRYECMYKIEGFHTCFLDIFFFEGSFFFYLMAYRLPPPPPSEGLAEVAHIAFGCLQFKIASEIRDIHGLLPGRWLAHRTPQPSTPRPLPSFQHQRRTILPYKELGRRPRNIFLQPLEITIIFDGKKFSPL